jgi:Tfp pilus assembly protein PilX
MSAMNMPTSTLSRRLPRRESGLALLVALLVLVAMSLAGIALVRSVDTASLVSGNIAFRQGASLAGDAGVEAARTYLMAAGNGLKNDTSGSGYYATRQDALDLTGNRTPNNLADDVRWPGTSGASSTPICLATDGAGNTVCYIIHRMCDKAGDLDAATCSTQTTPRGGNSLSANRPMATYQERGWTDVATMAYYRVTVRIAGPRNNVSYVQAFILI